MAIGFIRDEEQLRVLVLYILGLADGPLSLDELIELASCDGGVNYFELMQAVTSLTELGNIDRCGDDRLALTGQGKDTRDGCLDYLPASVRSRCDRAEVRRRASRVSTEIIPRNGESCSVRMSLSDHHGPLVTMDVYAPTYKDALRYEANFNARPKEIAEILMKALEREDSDAL